MIEKKQRYQTIITDSKDQNLLQSSFGKNTIINLPSFENNEEIINYFLQLAEQENNKILIASKSKTLLLPASRLGLATCFLNNGLNDIVDFAPTHELKIPAKTKKK